jgi:hypothetical protein
MGRVVAISRRIPVLANATTDLHDLERTALLAPVLNQANCARKSVDEGRGDHNLKFSNAAGCAGVRKLLARNNSAPREHKTFDVLNFLCA